MSSPSESSSESAQALDDAPAKPEAERPLMGPLAGLLWALAGAVVCLAVFEALYPVFRIPEELAIIKAPAPAEKLQERYLAVLRAERSNTVFFLGCFGAVLAGLLTMGEAFRRRSPKTACLAAPGSALMGAIFGSLAGWLAHQAFVRYLALDQAGDLAPSVQVQAIALAVTGGGVGLGLGAITKRATLMASCLIGGVLGGAIAAMLYPMLTALAMPMAGTDWPLPLGLGNRALWLGLWAGSLGITVTGLGFSRAKRRPS